MAGVIYRWRTADMEDDLAKATGIASLMNTDWGPEGEFTIAIALGTVVVGNWYEIRLHAVDGLTGGSDVETISTVETHRYQAVGNDNHSNVALTIIVCRLARIQFMSASPSPAGCCTLILTGTQRLLFPHGHTGSLDGICMKCTRNRQITSNQLGIYGVTLYQAASDSHFIYAYCMI